MGVLETIVNWGLTFAVIIFALYLLMLVVNALYFTYVKKKKIDVTKSFESKLIDSALISKPDTLQELYLQPEGYSGQRLGKIDGYTTLPTGRGYDEDVFVVLRSAVPILSWFPVVGGFFKKYMVVRHPSLDAFRTPLIGDITLFGTGLTRIGRFYYVTTPNMTERRIHIIRTQKDEALQESYTSLLKNMHTNVEDAMQSDSSLLKKDFLKEEKLNILGKLKRRSEDAGDEEDEY